MNYLPLQVITHKSLLESALKLEPMVQKVASYGFAALGISDLNNIYSFGELASLTEKTSIHPIYGIQVSFQYEEGILLHAGLYIENEEGYQNILALLRLEAPYSLEDILTHSASLTMIIKTSDSPFFLSSYASSFESLGTQILKLEKAFPHLFIGVEIASNDDVNFTIKLRDYASKHNLKLLAYPKICYLKKTDGYLLQLLEASKNKTTLSYDELVLSGPYFLLSPHAASMIYTEDELSNSLLLNDYCHFEYFKKRGSMLQCFPTLSPKALKEKMTTLAFTNLAEILKVTTLPPNYSKRLFYEIDIVSSMHYLDYFFLVADYVNFAKSQDIKVGPGRGSAAGSLLSYALRITTIDPLKYNLLFERFLNPTRLDMPDIDVDFGDERRGEVVTYLKQKYSEDKVAQIITFQTFGARSALNEVGRIFDYSPKQISAITRTLNLKDNSLVEAYNLNQEFRKSLDDPFFKRLYECALEIEGLSRQLSIHAAGLLINNEPLNKVIPLVTQSNTQVVGCEMFYLERQSFLKMDILGLHNLTFIQNIEKKITSKNQTYDSYLNHLDDSKLYQLLASKLTLGIFQLESYGISLAIETLKPTCFQDLVCLLALYRPGPMNQIKDYGGRKNKGAKITYPHPLLEPILSETYGIIVFQEQVMQIASNLASFSLAEADLFRRAISKKKIETITTLKPKFIEGLKSSGMSAEEAQNLYDLIEKFSNYGFNKSHAVAYAHITIQLLYYKAYFPDSFYEVLLDELALKDKKFNTLLEELKYFNISLKGPSILYSKDYAWTVNNVIYLPFKVIKGLSKSSLNLLTSLDDVRPSNINDLALLLSSDDDLKRTLQLLILSGALDDYINMEPSILNRTTLLNHLTQVMEYLNYKEFVSKDILTYHPVPDETFKNLVDEQECLGRVFSTNIASFIEKPLLKNPQLFGLVIDYPRKMKSKYIFTITDGTQTYLCFYGSLPDIIPYDIISVRGTIKPDVIFIQEMMLEKRKDV